MKRLCKTTLSIAGLSALLGSLPLTAQTRNLTADIPFTFQAAGETMPAGTYTLTSTVSSNGVFHIYNREARVSRLMNASIPAHYMPQESKLTFARSGNEYVLVEIAVAGRANTNRLAPRAIEKNTGRKLGFSSMISVPLQLQ